MGALLSTSPAASSDESLIDASSHAVSGAVAAAHPAVDALHKLLPGDRIGERAIVTFLRGVELRRHAIIPLEMPARG